MGTVADYKPSVYVASKTKYAPLWQQKRAEGFNIVSTWIDEAGPGDSPDLKDLWRRCIREASSATFTLLYRGHPNEVLKGALVEAGASLSHGRNLIVVGIDDISFVNHERVMKFSTLDDAFALITETGRLLTKDVD